MASGLGQGDLTKVQALGTLAEQCRYKFRPHEKPIKPYGLA